MKDYMSHLTPEVRAAKEKEMGLARGITQGDIDEGHREIIEDSGQIQKSAYNPEGKSMHDFVGTPVKTADQIEDDKIIKSNREIALRMTAVLARAERACRSTTTRAAYVDAIEAALDATDDAFGVAKQASVEDIQAQVRADLKAADDAA